MRGLYVGLRLHGKPSSVEGKGKCYCIIHGIQIDIYAPSRYSVLPALSLEQGVLHCDIIEGAFDTATFFKFIERTLDQMQPFPSPNSVIVMDNCRIHKHPDILHLIESR